MNFSENNPAVELTTRSDMGLRTGSVLGGWMLRGLLVSSPSLAECRLALRMSYQSLHWVNAGPAMASDSDELLLMRWYPRLPSSGSMVERTESFKSGLSIWRAALSDAGRRGKSLSEERDPSRFALERRMRQQILQHDGKIKRWSIAAS